jgi:hypothetical protein
MLSDYVPMLNSIWARGRFETVAGGTARDVGRLAAIAQHVM